MSKLSASALPLMAALLPSLAHPACDAASGPQTRALLELYTSEGCSSCPPADAWVGDVPRNSPSVVALTLHVPYWDYIGWRDPFAQAAFPERQRWLVKLNQSAAVYTPHLFVSGSEVQDWPHDLTAAIGSVHAQPARAAITLHAGSPGGRVLGINTSVTVPAKGHPALFLAVTEGNLYSKVERGENAGHEFRHQYVVREWQGPFAISNGRLDIRREITLPAAYQLPQLGVVAFVQDMDSGEVLQALSAYQCMG